MATGGGAVDSHRTLHTHPCTSHTLSTHAPHTCTINIHTHIHHTHSEEREVTAGKLLGLEAEVSSLHHELADLGTERTRLEEECHTAKEQLVQMSEEKEAMGGKVEQLRGEVGSKQDDIQAKTKLIAKVGELGNHTCLCRGCKLVVCV